MPAMERVQLHFQTESPQATHELGCVLGAALWAGDFVALHGQLGAGKTALVRGIAAGMGLDARAVSSPTFVIASEYTQAAGVGEGPVPLVHVDAYRLAGGEEELDTIGWDRVCDGSSVVAVEWAEHLGAALERRAGPQRRSLADVTIEATGAESRSIALDAPASWTRRPGWNTLAGRATASSEPRDWTTCPATGKPVPPDAPTWPFADERARLADLHKWLTGRYTVGSDDPAE